MEVIRMWEGGPLRQMSDVAMSGFIPYAKTINSCGFAGRYICDGCQEPSRGVRRQNVYKLDGNRPSGWSCDSCIEGRTRKGRSSEARRAAGARLAAARQQHLMLAGTVPLETLGEPS